MKLIIGMSNDDTFTVDNIEGSSLFDMREALDQPNTQFLMFEMDGREVLLNKDQIASIEIE